MLGVPSNPMFHNSSLKIRLRLSKLTPAVYFPCHCIFCRAHFQIGRAERCLCHCKISVLMFAMLRICALSVQCCTVELLCLQCQKSMFCNSKNYNFWAIFGCNSEQRIFCTGAAKRHSAKQRHIFRRHDIRTKQNGAHESTAAEIHRPHMTPTSMDIDSYTF